MNLRQLKIFIEVATNLNITKTAKKLFLAQPSVSLAIKELEEEYNILLFKRIKQKLILTDSGKELLAYAKKIIADVNLFEAKANKLAIKPNLNIASSLSIGDNVLASLIKNYPYYSDFNWHINILISSKIIDGVINGDYDFGIIETEVNIKNIKMIKLFADDLIVVAKKDMLKVKELSLSELLNYPLIVRDLYSGTRLMTDNIFKSYGLMYNPYCETATNQSLLDFVKNGLGIGVVSYLASKKMLEADLIEQIDIKDISFSRNIYLIYLEDRLLTKEEEKCINYLVDNIIK